MCYRVLLLLAIGAVLNGQSIAKIKVLDEILAEGVLDRGVQLDPQTFNRESLRELAASFEKETRRYRVSRLLITTTGETLERLRVPRLGHMRYRDLIREYRVAEKHVAIAEVLCLPNGAVLRYHNPAGDVGSWMIRGYDILHQTAEGHSVSILHVVLQRRLASRDETFSGEHVLKLFVTAATEDRQSMIRIAQLLWDQIGLKNLEIHISEFSWFPFESHYPAWNPFSKEEPPQDRIIAPRDEVRCYSAVPHLRCF